jgi:hypothetical protein
MRKVASRNGRKFVINRELSAKNAVVPRIIGSLTRKVMSASYNRIR